MVGRITLAEILCKYSRKEACPRLPTGQKKALRQPPEPGSWFFSPGRKNEREREREGDQAGDKTDRWQATIPAGHSNQNESTLTSQGRSLHENHSHCFPQSSLQASKGCNDAQTDEGWLDRQQRPSSSEAELDTSKLSSQHPLHQRAPADALLHWKETPTQVAPGATPIPSLAPGGPQGRRRLLSERLCQTRAKTTRELDAQRQSRELALSTTMQVCR